MVATLAYSTFQFDRTDRNYRRVEWALYLAESDGSRRQRLVAGRDWTSFAWAPNGEQLAYIAAPDPQDAATAGLYVVMADGSYPRRVAADSHLRSVWWSPDSRLLAFTTTQGEVPRGRIPLVDWSVIGADGSNPRRLASALSHYLPVWSPDSRHLALLSAPHPLSQVMSTLWLIAADGSDARCLIAGDADLCNLCWLAEGRHLSVIEYRGREASLYLVDSVAGTLDRFGPGREATWTPDSTSIAYVVVPDADEGESAVYVAEAESRGERNWTFSGRPYLSLLAWAPDGQRLALAAGEHLSVIEIGGSQSGPLAELYWDTEYTWSPDGRMIAFIGMLDEPSDEAPDSGAALEVIDVVRRQRRILAKGVQIDETVPDTPLWSPNGRQIAFTAFAEDGTEDVCVIDADGTNRRPLSQSAPEDFIEELAWCPDPRLPSRSGG